MLFFFYWKAKQKCIKNKTMKNEKWKLEKVGETEKNTLTQIKCCWTRSVDKEPLVCECVNKSQDKSETKTPLAYVHYASHMMETDRSAVHLFVC